VRRSAHAAGGKTIRRVRSVLPAILAVGYLLLPGMVLAADDERPDDCLAASAARPGGWHESAVDAPGDVDWYRFTTTADRPVLITLGDLVTDLRLDLHAACGTSLASSDQAGTGYEEIARTLPAGTYHVAVAGRGTATGAYALRFRALAPRVVVLSSRSFMESSRLRVVGEVLNAGPEARQAIRLRILFYDENDAFLGDATTRVRIEQLAPGQRAMFLWYETDQDAAPPGVDHIRVSIEEVAPATADRAVADLVVVPRPAAVEFGGGVFEGIVRNDSPLTLRDHRVTVTLYDDRGRVLNAGSTRARAISGGLPPGAEVGYRIDVLTQWAGASRVTIAAQGQQLVLRSVPRPGVPVD
jgi:hypothetical protein